MPDMSEIIKTTLEGLDSFTDVTLIPISKITVGFLGGGADYGQKKLSQVQNFGGGSGAGISITPIAFLSVSPDAGVNLIPLNNESKAGVDRISNFIDRSPEIIDRIKKMLS